MTDTIKTIYIHTYGDPSVGIQGESAQIVADGDFLTDLSVFDEKKRAEYLEAVRHRFTKAFGELWDEKPVVMFDFEHDTLNDEIQEPDGVPVMDVLELEAQRFIGLALKEGCQPTILHSNVKFDPVPSEKLAMAIREFAKDTEGRAALICVVLDLKEQ